MNEAFDADIGKVEMRGVLNSSFKKTTTHLLSSSTTALYIVILQAIRNLFTSAYYRAIITLLQCRLKA
jgi:hypothetical protein